MYNKLFSKIVDSSIWLEPTATRLIWVMFIAVMDEDGFVAITSVANVAYKARVTEAEATEAIQILESPDPNSVPDEHEGRRIERVPGGWIVLNSQKYRNMVTRAMIREQTRIRVARKRAKDKGVTQCNEPVTHSNDQITPSRAISKAKKEGANGSRPTSCSFKLAEKVAARFNEWVHFRKGLGKKPKDWDVMFNKQIEWLLRYDQQSQLEIIHQSMRNGWQGLFEPKNLNGQKKPTKPDYKRNYLPPPNNISDEELAEKRAEVRELSAKLRDELKK